jgi:phosphomannomutase
MSKNKITLKTGMDIDRILDRIEIKYRGNRLSNIDGVKIDFLDEWVHLRKSNTEPIIRIYTEAKTTISANELADRFISEIKELF